MTQTDDSGRTTRSGENTEDDERLATTPRMDETIAALSALPHEALMMYAEQSQMPDSSRADSGEIADWLTRNKPDLAERLAVDGLPEMPERTELVTGWGNDATRVPVEGEAERDAGEGPRAGETRT